MDKIFPFLVIGGFLVLAIGLGVFAHRANKKRMAAIGAALSGAGFGFESDKNAPGASEAFARLGPFRSLRTGSAGIVWHATGQLDSLPCTLVEHRYTTGSGKNRTTHYHTVAATPCGNWPVLELQQEHFFHKVADALGFKDIQLEDPEFNKSWRVKCKDENFALLVLTPELQAWLRARPKGTSFRLGDGAVCAYRGAILKPEQILDFARSAVELRRMIPAEVDSYIASV